MCLLIGCQEDLGISMCQDCANKYAASKARANAGFKDGTQLTKIVDMTPTAANTSGVRGVYYEKKSISGVHDYGSRAKL